MTMHNHTEDDIDSGQGRYPESWYPLLISRNLAKGKLKLVQAFSKEWVVFRGLNGEVGVVRRHCCHMGADLSNGDVIGNTLQCPLHGWRFDVNGNCCFAPDAYKNTSNLRSLHCTEAYGIIFVYWGESVAFSLPYIAEHANARPHVVTLDTPFYIVTLNSFDLNHLEFVHYRRPLIAPLINSKHPFNLTLAMEAEVIVKKWPDRIMHFLTSGRTKVEIECWGGSFTWMKNPITNAGAILTALPLSMSKSKLFIFGVDMNQHRNSLLGALRVMIIGWIVWRFFILDKKALQGMKPSRNRKFIDADAAVHKFWDFYESLPRFNGK